jgi:CTP synthase
MQVAVIEYSRNVSKIKDANSSEFDNKTDNKVIDIMEDQKDLKVK